MQENNATQRRQIIHGKHPLTDIFLYTKLCLIGARRTGVLWIRGNTWSMEGENWEEGRGKNQCDPSSTLTISERLRDEQLMTKHKSRLLDGYYFRSVANDKL